MKPLLDSDVFFSALVRNHPSHALSRRSFSKTGTPAPPRGFLDSPADAFTGLGQRVIQRDQPGRTLLNLSDAPLHGGRPCPLVRGVLPAMRSQENTIHEIDHPIVRQRAGFLHDLIDGHAHE